jgi:PPOX class probable F420-dependent enzyme
MRKPCHTERSYVVVGGERDEEQTMQASVDTETDTKNETEQLADLAEGKYVLLTTYKRDGTPVRTPLHIAARDGHVYVRTFDPSGKLKRIRNYPGVEVAPSTGRGKALGPSQPARARILVGAESAAAGEALAHKYPILHGHLIPWYHRRKGLTTTQLELVPR